MPRPTRPESGRRPDYDLKVYHKETGKSSYVGAGWKQENGSIKVSIDLCVHLVNDPNLTLSLWPVDTGKPPEQRSGGEKAKRGPMHKPPPDAADDDNFFDDPPGSAEIPF